MKIHRIRPWLEQKCQRHTAEGRVFRVIITNQRIDTARGDQERRTVFGAAGDHRFCQGLAERRGPLAGVIDGGIENLFELLFERCDQGDLRFRFRNFYGIRGFFRSLKSLPGRRGPLLEFRCGTAENSFALLDCIRHPIERMEGAGQFGFIAESPSGIDIVPGRVGMKERQRRLAGLFGAKFELQPTRRLRGQTAEDVVKFRDGQMPRFLLGQPRAADVAGRESVDQCRARAGHAVQSFGLLLEQHQIVRVRHKRQVGTARGLPEHGRVLDREIRPLRRTGQSAVHI